MQNRNYYDEKTDDAMDWSAFIAGGLIGAAVALLFAPQTGTELRGMLREYAGRAKEDVLDKAEEAYATGEEVIRDAGRSAKEFAQQGASKGQAVVKDAGHAAKEFVTQAKAEALKAGR